MNGRIGNANGVENTVEVVRDETITGPLGEECECKDDPKTLQIAGFSKNGLPANVSSNSAVEFNGGLDLLKFILDERIFTKSQLN